MAEPLTLDVREDLRRGAELFPRILQAVESLAPGQALRLLTTFEPIPLYAVLGRKGFGHEALRQGEGGWEVLCLTRCAANAQTACASPVEEFLQ